MPTKLCVFAGVIEEVRSPYLIYTFELLFILSLLWFVIRRFIKNRILRLAIVSFLFAMGLCPTVIIGDKGAFTVPFGAWLWWVIRGYREPSSSCLTRIALVLIMWCILYIILTFLEVLWRRRATRKQEAAK